jgi:NAD(P)-dependent dehydrogenase (short-subunit alcohol dehydrogenase family)
MIVVTQRLKNWNVVISGGATGAGGASSELFAREGAQIAIVDLNEGAAHQTADRIRQQGSRGENCPISRKKSFSSVALLDSQSGIL